MNERSLAAPQPTNDAPTCDKCGLECTTGMMAAFCSNGRQCEFWPHSNGDIALAGGELLMYRFWMDNTLEQIALQIEDRKRLERELAEAHAVERASSEQRQLLDAKCAELERALADARADVKIKEAKAQAFANEMDRLVKELDEARNSLSDGAGWISVKDRLPKAGVTVLAIESSGAPVEPRCIACYCDQSNRTLAGCGWLDYAGDWIDVSHWMPLPALPVPEGEAFALTPPSPEMLDAQRYRYLRDVAGQHVDDEDGPMVCAGLGDQFDYLRGADVDEAVDAAIKEYQLSIPPECTSQGHSVE